MREYNIHLGIQIVPLDHNQNTYSIIDRAIEVIQKSGIKHVITPMETVLEGPYELVTEIAKKAQMVVLESNCEEFLVNIRMHVRKSADVTMDEKRLDR